jgi:hypothetical protein
MEQREWPRFFRDHQERIYGPLTWKHIFTGFSCLALTYLTGAGTATWHPLWRFLFAAILDGTIASLVLVTINRRSLTRHLWLVLRFRRAPRYLLYGRGTPDPAALIAPERGWAVGQAALVTEEGRLPLDALDWQAIGGEVFAVGGAATTGPDLLAR